MRLSVSNIAWDPDEDEAVAALFAENGLDAIDVAPGKYFPEPEAATLAQVEAVRETWHRRGFEIIGMQALLFGTQGLNLFGDPSVQAAMLSRLGAVCRIGGGLGARRLVFGSPRNRDRGDLPDDRVAAIATDFFRRLGDLAAGQGVVVCLEPNPPRYGANFMTTAAETAVVVARVDHPAIQLQLDTGALHLAGESADAVLSMHAGLVGHVHASEPDLVPLGDGAVDHAAMAAAIRRHLPGHIVTVEMVATRDEPHPVSLARAVAAAREHYGRYQGRRA